MIAPGNVWSRRMESDVENAFVKLLPVSGDFLHAGLAFKIPQPENKILSMAKKEDLFSFQ